MMSLAPSRLRGEKFRLMLQTKIEGWRGGRAVPLLSGALCLVTACSSPGAVDQECRIVQTATALPVGLEETSGVAASRDHPGVLWTHNDSGGDPSVTAVRSTGDLVTRVRIGGARARDWEDIALGPCASGTCLYIADIGDGDAKWGQIDLYLAPEPDPAKDREVPAERYPARYPGGPRDAEALFVLPTGEIYLVTKGRAEAIEIYRYPLPLRPDVTVTLEPVVALADQQQPLERQVTGASASPSGEWVAIRTYKRLALHRTSELLSGRTAAVLLVDLEPLAEAQGEAVALLDNGAVVMTSEGGFPGAHGSLSMLRCPLEEE